MVIAWKFVQSYPFSQIHSHMCGLLIGEIMHKNIPHFVWKKIDQLLRSVCRAAASPLAQPPTSVLSSTTAALQYFVWSSLLEQGFQPNILLVGRPGGLNLWWLPWHSWIHRDWRRGELQVWVDQSYQSNLLSSSKFCLCASNHTYMHTHPSRHLQNGVWTCWSWTVAMQTRRSTRVAIPTWPMPWMPLVDLLCFLAVGQLMRERWLRGTL